MKTNGEMHSLWRAVDHEGEVLESFACMTRDKPAALKFMTSLGNTETQEVGRWGDNRAEKSHLPFRR